MLPENIRVSRPQHAAESPSEQMASLGQSESCFGCISRIVVPSKSRIPVARVLRLRTSELGLPSSVRPNPHEFGNHARSHSESVMESEPGHSAK